jgi:hypothetical protein
MKGDENRMKHKGIYLVFLLVLALLMFSGCARYDGTNYPDRDNYVTDNGIDINPNKGAQGADGLDGIGNDRNNNPNIGIPDKNNNNNYNNNKKNINNR